MRAAQQELKNANDLQKQLKKTVEQLVEKIKASELQFQLVKERIDKLSAELKDDEWMSREGEAVLRDLGVFSAGLAAQTTQLAEQQRLLLSDTVHRCTSQVYASRQQDLPLRELMGSNGHFLLVDPEGIGREMLLREMPNLLVDNFAKEDILHILKGAMEVN